jgi:hypothetical protein
MHDDKKVVFFLNYNNDLDQITPIIYKVANRGVASVDVVIWYADIDESDYRIQLIKNLNSVTVHSKKEDSTSNSSPFKRYLVEGIKNIGRSVPSSIPERIYGSVAGESTSKSSELINFLDGLAEGYNKVVICVDWTIAKVNREELSKFRQSDRFTTVVLPHGDAPFWNSMEQQELHFEELIKDESAFVHRLNLDRIARKPVFGKIGSMYDYHVMPNEANARRIRPFVEEDRIKILGSPRYNEEWLKVLSEHRPDHNLPSLNKLKVVMFNRGDKKYNMSKMEVENTIRLVTRYPNVHFIVKEHPRFSLIDPSSELRDISNLEIIKDEVQSASLVDWGDVFLELGTTIAFEPIMRSKPVFSLSYTHSNYATIAHYFPDSDMRCKDDLYYAFHDLIDKGCSDFYDEKEHQRFVQEMITSGNDSVLDAYADFIESCLDVNRKGA